MALISTFGITIRTFLFFLLITFFLNTFLYIYKYKFLQGSVDKEWGGGGGKGVEVGRRKEKECYGLFGGGRNRDVEEFNSSSECGRLGEGGSEEEGEGERRGRDKEGEETGEVGL